MSTIILIVMIAIGVGAAGWGLDKLFRWGVREGGRQCRRRIYAAIKQRRRFNTESFATGLSADPKRNLASHDFYSKREEALDTCFDMVFEDSEVNP